MKKLGLLFIALLAVGFIFAQCSDSPETSHMKYNLINEEGENLGEIQVYGSAWSDVDNALALRGLARDMGDDHTWGGEEHPWGGDHYRMDASADDQPWGGEYDDHPWGGDYQANTDKCKPKNCGDYAQADPAGDSCASSNSSCYCFPCPIVVSGSAKKHYKFNLEGAGAQTLQVYGAGSPTQLLDNALNLRGLRRDMGDDHPWGGEEFRMAYDDHTWGGEEHPWGGEYKSAQDKCKPVKCGDRGQADPAGDSCAGSNSSCYCFPCPVVVSGSAK